MVFNISLTFLFLYSGLYFFFFILFFCSTHVVVICFLLSVHTTSHFSCRRARLRDLSAERRQKLSSAKLYAQFSRDIAEVSNLSFICYHGAIIDTCFSFMSACDCSSHKSKIS